MRTKSYNGDNTFIAAEIVVFCFRSYEGTLDALQKAINHLSKVKKKDGEPIGSFDYRNIRLDYVNGEYIVKVEVLKEITDLGIEDNKDISNTTKALIVNRGL